MGTWSRFAFLLLIALLVAAGCGGGGGGGGESAAGSGGSSGGRLSIAVSRGSLEGLSRIDAENLQLAISQSTLRLTIDLLDANSERVVPTTEVTLESNTPQTVVIRQIPPGNYLLQILAFSTGESPIGQFSTHVAIQAGVATTVTASLSTPTPTPPPVITQPRLYVADKDGHTITAFSVLANGNLTGVSGSPFATGGRDPVRLAVDPTGTFLYVANSNASFSTGGANFASLLIDSLTGALSLTNTFPVLDNSLPSGVAVHPSSGIPVVYGTKQNDSTAVALAYNPTTGALTGVQDTAAASNMEDVLVHPSGQAVIFSGGSTGSELLVGLLDSGGSIVSTVPHSMFGDIAFQSESVVTSSFDRIYTTLNSNQVVSHDIDLGTGIMGDDDFASLGAVAPAPRGLDSHPSGNHLYVGTVSGKVVVLDLNPTTGHFLGAPRVFPVDTSVISVPSVLNVQVHPNGTVLYAAVTPQAGGVGEVQIFDLNPSTGDPTFRGRAQVGNTPHDLIFVP